LVRCLEGTHVFLFACCEAHVAFRLVGSGGKGTTHFHLVTGLTHGAVPPRFHTPLLSQCWT